MKYCFISEEFENEIMDSFLYEDNETSYDYDCDEPCPECGKFRDHEIWCPEIMEDEL